MPGHRDQQPAEQALVESEERFRTLASLATEGILIHERGVVIDASQRFCDLVGRPDPADLIGKHGLEAIGFTPEAKQALHEAMRTGSTAPHDVVVTRPDGSILHAETRGGGITYRGRPMRIVYLRDIGDRIRAEAERKRGEQERARLEESLQQAQKLESVGRLAGGVAHDFNNLLTVIGGNVSLALADLPADHRAREFLLEVTHAVESAANLTRQLLAFSRKQVINPKVVNLNTIVAALEKMLRRLLGEDVVLRASVDPSLGQTRVDPGQLEQILVNLAVNARDAMPEGGKLVIETANVTIDEDYCATHGDARPGRYVMLAVADNGTGMDAGVRSRVFEPFFTTKESGKGTGLGLAMVYGAVTQHGGHVEVSSEPGRGTTFRIYLPRVDEEVRTLPSEPEHAPRGTETVWLVEDADPLRILAVRLLSRLGYQVRAFASGREALDAASKAEGPIHLLLTDVVMPEMNGRVLAERMSVLRPGTKVLFTSGHTPNVAVDRGLGTQGTNFLPKPYSSHGLAARVREVLDG